MTSEICSVKMVFIEPLDDDKHISIKLLDDKYDQLSQLDTTWKLPINVEYNDANDEDDTEKLLL